MTLDALRQFARTPRSSATSIALEACYGGNEGIEVLDRDWDNLIILDACRYDVFSAVNDLDGSLTPVRSAGSSTSEFIRANFAGREAYDTVYVSSNAMVGDKREFIDVYKLVGLWQNQPEVTRQEETTENNTAPRSVPEPEPVVEKILEYNQKYPNKRLIAHFLPPHTPFLVKDGEKLSSDSPYRTFTAARRGEITAAEIRSVYTENVGHVLSYVAELVRELGGKTVVTADHGELLGEGVPWYIRLVHPRWEWSKRHYFDFGHYTGLYEPELVTVPWLEIESESRREVVAADEPAGDDIQESAIEEQLQALGYH